MQKLYLLPSALAIAGILFLMGGCEDKNDKKTSAATPAQVKTERVAATYLTAANAIPNAINPDWEVSNTSYRQAEIMIAQTPRSAPAKSAYRLRQEAKAISAPAPRISMPAANVSPARSKRFAAEIDADLIASTRHPVSAGRGYTGAASFDDVECPEIGRDLDAPRFSCYSNSTKPVVNASLSTSNVHKNRMPEPGPELGWVTSNTRSRY